jgi:hypothetical protein
MISADDFNTLRSIAQAGQDYDAIKRLLEGTEWGIDEDDIAPGFLRIFIPDATDKCYRLIIGYRDPDRPPYSFLTFSLFPASEEHLAAFNSAFHSAAEAIAQFLGAPTVSGERKLDFRKWSYAYYRWSLPEGEFTLVQDELDIQDGMDVTLWIQPVGTPLEETLQS